MYILYVYWIAHFFISLRTDLIAIFLLDLYFITECSLLDINLNLLIFVLIKSTYKYI